MHGWQIHILYLQIHILYLRIFARAFVCISYFNAARWRADTEITQKSNSTTVQSEQGVTLDTVTAVIGLVREFL